MTITNEERPRISIALSGGGVRAIAFHTGVFRFLAENDHMESIEHISSVSGGSLFVGLIFSNSEMRWPASADYLSQTLPAIEQLLTSTNLQNSALARLALIPTNWKYLLSRANVMAQSLQNVWRITGVLDELPSTPKWSINGTTAETGKRFRFKAGELGDYITGYAKAFQYPLAKAMAVSAAFPFGIGPLSIRCADYEWRNGARWGEQAKSSSSFTPPNGKLHIYDGGVYDNLGLEPFFDGGRIKAKTPDTTIIVSDAGAILQKGLDLGPLNPFRLKRILDIVSDQSRALRVRSFAEYLKQTQSGAYLQIGSDPLEKLREYGGSQTTLDWLKIDAIKRASSFPTSLRKMTREVFQEIHQHGYETAKWNQLAFSYLPPARQAEP